MATSRAYYSCATYGIRDHGNYAQIDVAALLPHQAPMRSTPPPSNAAQNAQALLPFAFLHEHLRILAS